MYWLTLFLNCSTSLVANHLCILSSSLLASSSCCWVWRASSRTCTYASTCCFRASCVCVGDRRIAVYHSENVMGHSVAKRTKILWSEGAILTLYWVKKYTLTKDMCSCLSSSGFHMEGRGGWNSLWYYTARVVKLLQQPSYFFVLSCWKFYERIYKWWGSKRKEGNQASALGRLLSRGQPDLVGREKGIELVASIPNVLCKLRLTPNMPCMTLVLGLPCHKQTYVCKHTSLRL